VKELIVAEPSYVVFDVETIPDGPMLLATKHGADPATGEYAADNPESAVEIAQQKAVRDSDGRSDLVPLPYQIPVVVAMVTLDDLFRPLGITGAVRQPTEATSRVVTKKFWHVVGPCSTKLVSFNGRAFDLPVMELAAFRLSVSTGHYYEMKYGPRHRHGDQHIDLLEFFTNFGTHRLHGGLNYFAKLLGLPGKQEVTGRQVYSMFKAGQVQEIADYCLADVLDTYLVFLRTRVLIGLITSEQETSVIRLVAQFLRKHQGRTAEAAAKYATALECANII
jgi:3'-5' exonuclease